MFTTDYGLFDGDLWEAICQKCFKQKYGDDYQEMIASPGDFGIEGYTRTGKVFQCYCPDENYNPDLLYEKQRDKITIDLQKLIDNSKELIARLGDVKIKEWIFVTPKLHRNEIRRHCVNKTNEYRSKNCGLLDSNFEVLVQDVDFLHPHLFSTLGLTKNGLMINPSGVLEQDLELYKKGESQLVDNALRKHRKRVKSTLINLDARISSLTDTTIRNYLDGNDIIAKWQNGFAPAYEKFKIVVSQLEEDVENMCAGSDASNNALYEKIKDYVKAYLEKNFDALDPTMITNLSNHVIAGWLLNCPIDFE